MCLTYVQSVSLNLTEIQFTNALDLGMVLWIGRYIDLLIGWSIFYDDNSTSYCLQITQ